MIRKKDVLEVTVTFAVALAFIMPGVVTANKTFADHSFIRLNNGESIVKIETTLRSDNTIVSILPSTQTVGKGETFIISVYVEPDEPIIGIKFNKLYFNQTLIHANSVTLEGFFDPYDTFFNDGDIDNINGEITNVYEVTVPIINVSTDGYFCNISFTAQLVHGISELDLEGVIVPDANGNPVSIIVNDGEVIIGDKTPPQITNVAIQTTDPLDTDIGWENFTCTVTDNVAVDEVKLILTGDIVNEYPMFPGLDDTYYYNFTITTADEYTYHIWANDTYDNDNTSTPQSFDLPTNYDVDISGKCHFMDLMAVAKCYNSIGPDGWIREDVDNNGKVHFMDLMTIANHYHEEW